MTTRFQLEQVRGKSHKRLDLTYKKSDVDPVSLEEFPDVGTCNFDFSTWNDTMKTTANPKEKKYKKQKKERINFLCLLIHLWPGRWEDQLE